jgi:iron complex outermembrane receptor protein
MRPLAFFQPIAAAMMATLSTAAMAQTAAPSSSDNALSEITVTAQRRAENLQNIPISVEAASASQLTDMGIQSTGDLGLLAPAVTISTGLGGAETTIRGVGGTNTGVDESPNAVYIDGVYQPSAVGALFSFNNIDRIEVLKGPQGTLFGRNASGGVIQIITRTPQFDTQGSVELGYGNYDTTTAKAYFTTPLSSNVAIDFAYTYQDQSNGWGHDIATGQQAYKGDSEAGRSKLLWNIDADTSVTAAVTYAKTFAPPIQGGQILPGEILKPTGATADPNFYNTNENQQTRVGSYQTNEALWIKHNFDFATFTSITSHDNTKFSLFADIDMTPVNLVNIALGSDRRTWTQEFQLTSAQKTPLEWVAGLYYFNSDQGNPSSINGIAFGPPPGCSCAYGNLNTTSYAAYGQTTWTIVDGTRLTGGLRYTDDRITSNSVTGNGNPAVPLTVFPELHQDDGKVTWHFAFDQQLSQDVLAYISASRGFKSGLFNSTQPQYGEVQPQTTDAYEIGLKSEFLDHKLRFNIAGYFNHVTDLQVKGFAAGTATLITYNAPGALFRGVDIDVEAAPIEGLNIQAGFSYDYGTYSQGFTNAVFYTVPPAPAQGLIESAGNASGLTPQLTPRAVPTLAAQYKIPAGSGEVVFAGAFAYNSGYYFDPQDRTRQPGYGLLNASVAWKPIKSLQFRVWSENLADKEYYANIEPGTFGDNYYAAPPRTFGVTASYSFLK